MTNIDIMMEIAKTFGNSPFLTVHEASTLLKKSPEWLQHQRRHGVGPRYSQLGKARNAPIIYSIVDLVQYVEVHSVETA